MDVEQQGIAQPPSPPLPWTPPRLTLRWGDYFKPNAQDARDTFQAIASGIKDCQIVTKRKAVEMAQRIMKVDNVDAYMETLEEEAAEKQAKADEAAQKAADHEIELMKAGGHGDDQGGSGPGASKNPAQKGSGGGSVATPPPPKSAPPVPAKS